MDKAEEIARNILCKYALACPTAAEEDQTICFDHAVAAIREAMQSAWIPVSERLPEVNGEYLAYPSFFGKSNVVAYFPGSLAWVQAGVSGKVNEYITHWQPLPDPPRATPTQEPK